MAINLFKNITEAYGKLITNNSGNSIKSAFLFWVFLVGIVLLLIVGVVLLIDVISDGKVESNIADLASFVTAISRLFVAAGLPKIAGEVKEIFKKEEK